MHNRHHTKPAPSAGFTLIEMAIVVALFGLLAGGGMVALGQFLDQIALKKTDENLAKVEKALSLYVLQEGWLPCPDTDGTGVQNLTGNACAVGGTGNVIQAMVPYRDLGLQLDDVEDGWNRRFTYVVTYDLAGGRDLPSNVSTSIQCTDGTRKYTEVASLGEVEPLEDADTETWPDQGTPADPLDDPPRSAYALISHGENGFGAFLTNGGGQYQPTGGIAGEDLNASHTNNVRGSAEITAGVAAYDDIVRTRTPAQILYDMGCRNDGSTT